MRTAYNFLLRAGPYFFFEFCGVIIATRMSEDLYDIKVLVRKIWEPTRNCLRNNFFNSLPPYDADQFARIQGTNDNYMKGYLIKRKYQLFLSQILQLVMIIIEIVSAVSFVSNSDKANVITRKSVVSITLLGFSMIFIESFEWIILSISLYHANHKKTLIYSHVALFSVFVVRLFYLYLPYRDMIKFESTNDFDKAVNYVNDFIAYIRLYGIILMFLLPNLMLLRAAKKSTFYLSQYYDNVTKDDFFYHVHFILSWIYVLFVSIFYGIAYVVVHYVIWYDENQVSPMPGLGLDGYLKEEYVPILWMIWFLSVVLELAPKKTQCSCLAETIAVMCNVMWWMIVLIILYYTKLLTPILSRLFAGYAQYYQLKLQLRDFFVALEYRRRTDTRPHYGGERVVEMLHMDPPTMPMDIQSDASPTAVHIPISAAGYQKVEEAS